MQTTPTEVFTAALHEQTATMAYSAAIAMDRTDELVAALPDDALRALHRVAGRLTAAAQWEHANRAATATRSR